MNNISVEMSSSLMGDVHPEIRMNFLNGNITVPGRPGGYVIASGCGSGKTSVIKEIIKKRFPEGILYSAATIKECNEMYEYCKQLSIELKGYFNLDNVIVLHSDYTAEGTDNDLWRNNPEKLYNKSVIICTHAKLLNESPELLLRYMKNPINSEDMSLISRGVSRIVDSGVVYMPRKYVLVDELPTYKTKSYNISRSEINVLGFQRQDVIMTQSGEITTIPYFPIEYHRPAKYSYMKRLNESNRIPEKYITGTDRKSELEKELMLSQIYENYEEYSNNETVSISYNLSDLIINYGMDTRILLFEGTGDLTFNGSKRFEVLTYDNKYNSEVSIDIIHNSINRVIDPSYNLIDLLNGIDKNVDELEKIIRNPESTGTLIITWMNLKDNSYKVKKITRLNATEEKINENFDLPEYYKCKLRERGLIGGYEIIHYMGGLDKATNEFKEFNQIVFLGEFHVPLSVVKDFNDRYKCQTNKQLYTLYQLVQAICRTRIRKHKGEEIHIFFTDDWNNSDVNRVKRYLKSDEISKPYSSDSDPVINKFTPKWRKVIRVLCENNDSIDNMIYNDIKGDISIELSDLFKILPMSEYKVKKYYPLINCLRKVGINLTIIVNKQYNNQYTVNRVSF